MTPSGLLGAALDLLERPAADPVGGWPRAVALLTRQALEQALDEFWQSGPPIVGMTDCTMRTQLICLHGNLEPDLAREIGYVWPALSNACHYHPYDLAPTAAELRGWIDAVATLLATISGRMPRPQGARLRWRRAQAGGLLVKVADLDGVIAESIGEQRADGPEFCERLVGPAVGGQQLRDNEAGLKNLAGLVFISGCAGVLHVEAQLREGLAGVAGLGVGVSGVVGAVQHSRGAGVLAGVEQRGTELMAQGRHRNPAL